MRKGINKCEEVIRELEINSTTTQTQINQLFNQIRTKLNEREQELLNKLDEIEKTKKKTLDLQIEELNFGVESIIGSCQMIEQSLALSSQNNDNVRLLSMRNLYHSRLNYLINNNWKTEPHCHSLIEFSISEKDENFIYSNFSDIGILDSNEVSAIDCVVSINENQRIFKGEECTFEIISYSGEGNEMKKGGNGNNFKIQIERELNNENSKNNDNEWKIVDLNNGKYEVRMKFKDEGNYSIFVKYNEIDLYFLPFKFQVISKPKQRNYDEIKEPLLTFGRDEGEDENEDEYLTSHGITIDSNGNIYSTRWYIHQVQIFNSEGDFISSFGSKGKENGQFYHPSGIGVNSKGNIIVCDSFNHRIQIFNSDGKFISKFDQKEMKMVNFIIQKEFALMKMTIFMFVIVRIIEFKYLTLKENLFQLLDQKEVEMVYLIFLME